MISQASSWRVRISILLALGVVWIGEHIAGAGEVTAHTDESKPAGEQRLLPEGSYTTQIAFVLRRIDEITAQLEATAQARDRLKSDQDSLRQKIKSYGLTASNQLCLLEARRNLPSLSQCQASLKRVNQELELIELERLRLEEPGSGFGTGESSAESDEGQGRSNPSNQSKGVTKSQAESNKCRELLEALANYRANLAAEGASLTERSSEIVAMKQYLDGQLMWVRDCEPLGVGDVRNSIAGGLALARPNQWIELGRGLLQRIITRPYELGLLAGGLLAISFGSRWLNRTT